MFDDVIHTKLLTRQIHIGRRKVCVLSGKLSIVYDVHLHTRSTLTVGS